jgi:hypothetical protein
LLPPPISENSGWEMPRPMLAMELIPAIRELLAELEGQRSPVLTGRRAALWRAQQHAAKIDHSIQDLRRYCLEALAPRRSVEESEYLRGYREGFQAVLRAIREIETDGTGPNTGGSRPDRGQG